ncbi:MAG TPA: alpha/beta hydrolase-fold protein [Candidatus Limnocylindrales bacterium]
MTDADREAHRRVPFTDPRTRWIVAVGAALLAAGLLVTTGSVDAMSTAFTEMGFDPDRSRFIAALIAASIVGGAAGFVLRSRWLPALAGLVAFVGLFGPTFVVETQSALGSPVDQGTFDRVGWGLTLLAEGVFALLVGWAGAVLAWEVRTDLVDAVVRLRARPAGMSRAARIGWPAWLAVAIVALAVSAPVFGDLTNFGMDSAMRGGQGGVGLVGGGASASGGPAGGPAAGPAGAMGGVGGPSATSGDPGGGGDAGIPLGEPPGPDVTPPPPVLSGTLTTSARPWLAWAASGRGTVTETAFPAPWTGGTSTTAYVDVYTPPGYGTGSHRYPVIYEFPWVFRFWDRSVHIGSLFDGMISRGEIPPSIVVFVAHNGGPYPDSECVDSFDGREKFDTYVAQAVVPWVDRTYRTVATPAGRTLFGFSMGGFCSAVLALHHPELFGQAISFSGYYVAGIRSGQTVNAWRPFGNDPGAIARNSPLAMARTLPTAARTSLLFVLVGTSWEPFYGPQYKAFAAELKADGYGLALLESPLAHSWAATRALLPTALRIVAAHQAAVGVFAQ